MMARRQWIAAGLAAVLFAIGPGDAAAKVQRSHAAKSAFCRATGFPDCHRPGYVVDHVIPLACGGADAPANMQWQTIADGTAKDRWERKGCETNRTDARP